MTTLTRQPPAQGPQARGPHARGPHGERPRAASAPATFDPRCVRTSSIGAARLLRGIDAPDPGRDEQRRIRGDHRQLDLAGLVGLLDGAGLTGRGGAGFPLADKVRALRPGQRVVVVNGAEGEPGSAKDAVLLSRVPHVVLDGAIVVADAIAARLVIVAVTDPTLEQLVRSAIGLRPDAHRFEVRRVPARFIAGEARTLIRTLNGGPQLPPGRRVHATEHGVGGEPTLLANAETFAHVGALTRTGPAPAAGSVHPANPCDPVASTRVGGANRQPGAGSVGGSSAEDETGTTLLSVTGAVGRPGVVEVPIGLPLGELAAHVGAQPSPWVVIGGYHGAWLTADPGLPLSRTGLRAAGGTLGAGTVMFIGADTCPSAELSRVASWLARESARQCGPCAFGLPALAEQVRALGHTARSMPATMRMLDQLPGRGACAHPDGAARFLGSGLHLIAADLRDHHTSGHCGRADRGYLAIERGAAFTARERS
jgi:NADH:ubiquinone oxidoreductase subunit F (NADH-binding)